MPWRFEK